MATKPTIYDQFNTDFEQAKNLYNLHLPNAPLERKQSSLPNSSLTNPGPAPYDLASYFADLDNQVAGGLHPALAQGEKDRVQGIMDQWQKDQNSYQQSLANNQLNQQSQDLLKQRQSLGTPGSSSFAGNIDKESQGVLDAFKNQTASAGTRSSETQNLLKQYQTAANTASNRSMDMQDIVSRFKSGLDGYSSAENLALREAGTRSIKNQAATDRRNNAALASRYGVRGANALAQQRASDRNTADLLAQFDQDLFVRNVDEKQNRLTDYSNFLKQLEDTEFGRGLSARDAYQSVLSGIEKNEYDQITNALRDYAAVQENMSDRFYGRGVQAQNDYEASLEQARALQREIEEWNTLQGEKESARDAAGITGMAGLFSTQRSADAQNKILAKR